MFFSALGKTLVRELHLQKDEFVLKLGHECTKSVQLFSCIRHCLVKIGLKLYFMPELMKTSNFQHALRLKPSKAILSYFILFLLFTQRLQQELSTNRKPQPT